MSRCCIYCRIGGTANEPNQIAMNSQLEMLRKLLRISALPSWQK